MNKLYDAIDPIVIDDELLKNALKDTNEFKEAEKNGQQLEFNEVEELNLSFKSTYWKISSLIDSEIRRIANLTGFDKLTKLKLDNNDIERIENLGHLVHLKWLDLSFNKISKIEGLESLIHLTDLSLHSNKIVEFGENMNNLVSLEVLSIGKNQIGDIAQVASRLSLTVQLMYLRKFKKLSVLNLAGNPVCSAPDYTNYVIARVPSLKYLDYRIVDEPSMQHAQEQYQDELREIIASEKSQEDNQEVVKQKEAKREILKTANLQELDTIYEDIMKEDVELPKLKSLHFLEEAIGEYKERFHDHTEAFITQMLENHKLRLKEKEEFQSACESVQQHNDQKCLKIIENYNKKKKEVFREAKSLSKPQQEKKVELLRQENKICYDKLLDLEMQLVEQFEEFTREFEAKIFGKLRDLESGFHEKIMSLCMQEMLKFNKNELEYELVDEAKALLSDKEILTNIVNASHDSQSLQIESKEDDISKFESQSLEDTINNIKNREHQRSTNRVSELYSFISMQNSILQTALESNFEQI